MKQLISRFSVFGFLTTVLLAASGVQAGSSNPSQPVQVNGLGSADLIQMLNTYGQGPQSLPNQGAPDYSGGDFFGVGGGVTGPNGGS